MVKARLEEVLKDRAPQFSASILSLVNAKAELQRCAPDSIVGAAMIAASLDLPINPNLGFAHIVPYKGRAQFQMGYKGFVQLGMRTGQYRYLNACPVCEGELVEYNKLSGRVVIDESKKTAETVVGYAAYFQMLNGFEHAIYWTDEQVWAHAKRFSQAVRANKTDSPWFTDRAAMSCKTVVKSLLSKWGLLSVEMMRAIDVDQRVYRGMGDEGEYEDNPGHELETRDPAELQAGKRVFGFATAKQDAKPAAEESAADETFLTWVAELQVVSRNHGWTQTNLVQAIQGAQIVGWSLDDLAAEIKEGDGVDSTMSKINALADAPGVSG